MPFTQTRRAPVLLGELLRGEEEGTEWQKAEFPAQGHRQRDAQRDGRLRQALPN